MLEEEGRNELVDLPKRQQGDRVRDLVDAFQILLNLTLVMMMLVDFHLEVHQSKSGMSLSHYGNSLYHPLSFIHC